MDPIKFHDRLSFRISILLSIVMLPLLILIAWRIIERQSEIAEDLLLQKGKSAAQAGAAAYGAILELGVDSGQITLDDITNPKYVEIPYPFKHEHKRYHTKFDAFTDSHVAELQDAILNSSPDFIFSSGMDQGGYVPTAHTRYNKEPRGDANRDGILSEEEMKWDRDNSRMKRKYQEPEPHSAASFRSSILQPVGVFDYPRDSGKTLDVVAEITVKGEHFGAFRVGVRFDRIESYRLAIVAQLGRWFGVLVLTIVLVIFAIVTWAMRPLNKLVKAALTLASGDNLDVPVLGTSRGEVDAVAYALNELRRGMLFQYKRAEKLASKPVQDV